MVLWEGSKQVGLAPGQTEGEVNGTYIYRDPSSDIRKPYVEATNIQTVGLRGGRKRVTVNGRTFYVGAGEVPDIGYYRREAGFRSVRRLTSEDFSRADEQLRQMAQEKQRQAQQQRPMFTAKGRLLQPSKRLPSTPIRKETPTAYGLYMKPFYDYAANLSQGLQYKYALAIEKTKTPREFKQFAKGAGTSITGLPEFFGSGAAGIEYGARHPKEAKEKIIPAVSSYAVGFAGLAIKDPFYATGQLAGVLALGKASKIKTSSLMKDTSASLSLMPRPKPFPRQIQQMQFKKRPAYTHEIYYEEPIVKSRVAENLLNNIRDYAVTRKPILTTIAGSRYKYGVGIFTPQRIATGSSIRASIKNAMFQGLSIGQRSQLGYGNTYRTAYGTGLSNLMRVDLKQATPQLTRLKSIQDLLIVQKVKQREPLFRRPKPLKFEMPTFEIPDVFGLGKRRKQGIKEKVIVTRMLSLKDIFGKGFI